LTHQTKRNQTETKRKSIPICSGF